MNATEPQSNVIPATRLRELRRLKRRTVAHGEAKPAPTCPCCGQPMPAQEVRDGR